MKNKLITIFLFLTSFSNYYCANSNKTDSLRSELKKSLNDTTSVNLLNSLVLEFRKTNPEQALNYSDIALNLCKRADFKKGEGNTYLMMGAVYFDHSNFNKALECYSRSFVVRESVGDKRGVAESLNNIGDSHINLGDYQKALTSYLKSIEICESIGEKKLMKFNNIAAAYYFLGNYEKASSYYFKALKTFEELGNKEKTINPLLGIGNVHKALGEYKTALVYYKKALAVSEEVSSLTGVAKSLTTLGNVYEKLLNNDTALSCYLKSLQIMESIGEQTTVALSLMNIGNVYSAAKNYDKALEYYEKALKTNQTINNKDGEAKSLLNVGILYSDKGNQEKAIQNLKKSLSIASSIKSKEIMMEGSEELSETYFKIGDFKNAYMFYRDYNAVKDSTLNESNTKNIAEINTKYETDKKEKEIELLTKDNLIQDEKLKNETNVRNGFVIVSLLLLLLVFLAYNRYRIKQKANKEIAEKNREITESISYAKRIQSSFLTSEKYIAQRLSDYFIFYEPRNIVSGDFYWLMEKDNSFYVCTADCTGHGIPGAFMSLISMGILNEIIYSKTHISHTDDILNELRRIIIMAVNPEGAIEEGKDGMDAVLCRYDFQKMELEYSAANNSFYIIREGELLVFKPDKMPVGKHYGIEKPFTRNNVPIQKGDCVYTFSDGFADQFGGSEGKKFQTKRLKELLLNHCHKPMKVQVNIIKKAINEWKGKEEQVDDILVIGIRV